MVCSCSDLLLLCNTEQIPDSCRTGIAAAGVPHVHKARECDMKSLFSIKAAFLAACLMLPSILYSAAPETGSLGKITACNGRLNIIRNGEISPASIGSDFLLGDKVQSENGDGLMELLIYDIGRVTIGKLSSVKVKTFIPSESEAPSRVAIDLISGTAHINVGDNEINVRTPIASVRSSRHGEFYVRHVDNETDVFCIEDNTTVRNAALGWEPLSECSPGFFIRVSEGNVPSLPMKIPEELLAELVDLTDTSGTPCGASSPFASDQKDARQSAEARPVAEAEPLGYAPPEGERDSAIPDAVPPMGNRHSVSAFSF